MKDADRRPALAEPQSIKAELSAASRRIERGEAELLLAHLLGRDRSWLFAWSEHTLTDKQIRGFHELVERRSAGLPIAQLTGRRAFWTLELEVNADTLIPRPETELLVEWALEIGGSRPRSVLDLGTGSGAIALALASERPDWRIDAIDRSNAALTVARRNAERSGLAQVHWLRSDWFEQIPRDQRFDLIISNPPYVAREDPHLQRGDLRFEPRSALTAGTDGLDAIRLIIAKARPYLGPEGGLLVEHGYNQAGAVRALLAASGFEEIRTRRDLAGQERATAAMNPEHGSRS